VGVDVEILEEAVASGGTIITALPPTKFSPNHHVEMAVAGNIHDLESFKTDDFKFHGGNEPRDSKGGSTLKAVMAWTIAEAGRKYLPAKVRKLGGRGMYDALKAFQLMKANKISAEKVVWRMAETPGLPQSSR
jgi:hypothetical protein